jgi:hypothetical protein
MEFKDINLFDFFEFIYKKIKAFKFENKISTYKVINMPYLNWNHVKE